MKRILSLFCAAVIFMTSVFVVFAAEKGDVDSDGSITAADARLALRFSVSLDNPTDEQKTSADMDSDGNVTAADARTILRISVGLGDKEPEQEPIVKPEYVPSEKELEFYDILYNTAHPLLGAHPAAFDNAILKNFQKWCCLYTIGYVFRPALETAGYSKEAVNRLAPRTFSADSLAKLLSNVTGTSWSDKFVIDSLPLYVPSLLADYYIKNPDAADVYFLYDFYDDMIEQKVYEHSDEDRANYQPRVGDVLFISNKTRTYANGYPTVDHTAQIIKVLDDGTFICTEGSLIDQNDPSGIAKVQERRYMYNEETGSYVYRDDKYMYKHIVVLYAAQPKI